MLCGDIRPLLSPDAHARLPLDNAIIEMVKLLSTLSHASAWKLVIGWVILLSILYSTLSVVRHNHFQSGGFDLGIYDQAVWQYATFQWPYNTVKERFILGDHFTLTLTLAAPLFWIWNDVRALLIFQAIFVSISIIAVYKLVLLRKFSPFTSFGISFIYSLFYGIQYGLFFDFHPVLLATGIIPWMLFFLESNKTKLFILSLTLLLLTQENMGLSLAFLGFIYIWQAKYRRVAVAFIIGGIVASLIAVKGIAFFSPVGFQYAPHLTLNPILFMKELFNAPEKQQVWLYTMSAFTFLPLLSPGAMIAIVLELAQYFTTGPDFARMWSPYMHHRAILAPLVLLGTLDALAFLQKKKINITLVTMVLLISTLAQQFLFHYPLNKLSKSEFWHTDSWIIDNEKMIATIPADIPIATQQSLIPHLSHRKQIYLAWPRVHEPGWWLDTPKEAKYLLIDTHPNEWVTMLLESPDHVNEALANMEKLGKITLLQKINDIRLYKINN